VVSVTDEELVLVSDGRHSERYHRPVGGTGISGCGRLDLSCDTDAIPREDAEADGYTPCKNCSFPERPMVADGGEQ
jgi:hypothetical protein